ncbi:MAG TPA: hypothetical protein VKN14_05690 [Flavobacteriaceae bacterium]|nr:hypothetical protein [Flavobacteriaceae bacterium]
MEVSKKNIEKIDYIIDRLIQFESSVSSNDLHRDGYYDEYNDDKKKIEQDFSLLIIALDELGILDSVSTKQGDFINYTPKVLKFKNTYGSYKNYYEKTKEQSNSNETELQKEKKRQELKDKLDRMKFEELEYKFTIRGLEEELKISSLIKNYWWLILSAIGIGISIGRFLL